jgi:hypothetical protein
MTRVRTQTSLAGRSTDHFRASKKHGMSTNLGKAKTEDNYSAPECQIVSVLVVLDNNPAGLPIEAWKVGQQLRTKMGHAPNQQ